MPIEPRCFCGQLAKPTKTKCGVALRCGQTHFCCGFHIHLNTWNQFRQQIKERKLDPFHPELASCPRFNFTFCTLFHIKNHLKMETPPPPACKCGVPMVLHTFKMKCRFRTVFVCSHHFEKQYCHLMFHAEDVVFEDPQETPYQNVVTRNTIQSIQKPIKNEMNELMAKTKDQVTLLYNQQRGELDGMKREVQQLKDTVHRLETLVAKEHHFHQQFKQESEELSTLIKHLALEIKLQGDMKCVVCFQNKVEVAMVPCYHFGNVTLWENTT